jgi:hypothetical protein
MVYEYMETALESYNSNNGKIPYKQRFRVAGSLMYMMKKYKT